MSVQSVQSVQTRSQNDFILAHKLVTSVFENSGENTRKIYGGLCHSFPIMVLTCGLCQAVAFADDKSTSKDTERAEAHKLLLAHVGRVLEVSDPVKALREDDALAYIQHTRRLLDSWIYFKRFAVSILRVEEGNKDD